MIFYLNRDSYFQYREYIDRYTVEQRLGAKHFVLLQSLDWPLRTNTPIPGYRFKITQYIEPLSLEEYSLTNNIPKSGYLYFIPLGRLPNPELIVTNNISWGVKVSDTQVALQFLANRILSLEQELQTRISIL